MTIIEQISRALALKHYTDRFRPAEGREKIIQDNVDANWMIFSADAAMALQAAGEAFAELCHMEAKEWAGKVGIVALNCAEAIRNKIEEELGNG